MELKDAVFTVKRIVDKSAPILYIVHDTDDEWQFLSGEDVSTSDIMIVSMDQILDIDKSLGDLSWLPQGMFAVRKTVNHKWISSPISNPTNLS